MFALSRDGERFFLHQPDDGMMVPVLLDLKNRQMTVKVPSIDELEHDYAVYRDMGEVADAVGDVHRSEVTFASEFSKVFSKIFHEQILHEKMTIAQLRKLVIGIIQDQGKAAGKPSQKTARIRERGRSGHVGNIAAKYPDFNENLSRFIEGGQIEGLRPKAKQRSAGSVTTGTTAREQSPFRLVP